MIEATIKEIDGVRFYSNIRILESDDTIGGFPIHYIPDRVSLQEPELIKAIKLLGLRKVGRNLVMCGGSDVYAQLPAPYIGVRIVQVLLRMYWGIIRWLYGNARFFKQVPEAECFSWRYFTPYAWFKKLK